jgi:chondroitin 4-sulfotransferase 11
MKESKKWMVVRHPFERILSAYRDKLENSTINRQDGTLHFYEKYGRKIVGKYRGKSPNEDIKIEPTFKEFVSYLIDTDLTLYADDHWIPYYLFCTPCLIDYDVIIQFETLQQDVQLLLNLLGEKSGGPKWKHSKTAGRRSKTELIKSYYNQLDNKTILKLYDKYKIDFELFGYSIDGYLSI